MQKHGPGLRGTARSALIAQHTRSGCPGPEQQKYAAAESFLLRGFQGMLEPEGQDLSPRPSITPGLHAGRARKLHRSVMGEIMHLDEFGLTLRLPFAAPILVVPAAPSFSRLQKWPAGHSS